MRKYVLAALGLTAATVSALIYVYYGVNFPLDYLDEDEWWRGQA